jgi:hypothetical protein
MRDEIFSHVFIERLQIVTIEYVLKIGSNPPITLIYGHYESSLYECAAKQDFAPPNVVPTAVTSACRQRRPAIDSLHHVAQLKTPQWF